MSDKTKDPSEDEISADVEEEAAEIESSEKPAKKEVSGTDGDIEATSSQKAKSKSVAKPAKKVAKPEAKVDSKDIQLAAIEGIFHPGQSDIDVSSLPARDSQYDVEVKSGTMKSVVFIGVVLAVLLGTMVVTGRTGDVISVIQGDYLEKKIATTRLEEEAHRQAQLDALDRFGTLLLKGEPWDALVRLNGQVQYGQTSSGEWRELRLGASTPFQNLKIKELQKFEVSAAGHTPQAYEVTEGMWQEAPGGVDYRYELTATLAPASELEHQEFNLRMEGDLENDYHGSVKITSVPEGAKVIFNNNPLLDKDGNELVTPVTFDRNFVKDEAGKLVEEMVRVDTPPDNGHKIQVQFADNEEMPKYVTQLQRRMWTCEWKEGADTSKLDSKLALKEVCDYTWALDMNFTELKSYIETRAAEEKRIIDQMKEFQAGQEAAAESEKG